MFGLGSLRRVSSGKKRVRNDGRLVDLLEISLYASLVALSPHSA